MPNEKRGCQIRFSSFSESVRLELCDVSADNKLPFDYVGESVQVLVCFRFLKHASSEHIFKQ